MSRVHRHSCAYNYRATWYRYMSSMCVPPYTTPSTLLLQRVKLLSWGAQPSVSPEESHLRRDITLRNYVLIHKSFVCIILRTQWRRISGHAALWALSTLTKKKKKISSQWSKSIMIQGPQEEHLQSWRTCRCRILCQRSFIAMVTKHCHCFWEHHCRSEHEVKNKRPNSSLVPVTQDQSKSREPALH